MCLSDRVYVLSRRPSRVIEQVEIQLERPRNQLATREDPRFIQIRRRIFEFIRLRRRPRAPGLRSRSYFGGVG